MLSGAVGCAPALFHVWKIERHNGDAARRQAARIIRHERMKVSRAGAMRKHEQRIEIPVLVRRIEGGRYGCVGVSRELEGSRHNLWL